MGNAAMSLIPASYIEKSWHRALSALEYGRLEFIAPNGEVTIAEGPNPGPHARFHIHEWDVLRRIMARGDIGLGEEYIAGSWDTDSVEKLVSLFLLNLDHFSDFSDGNIFNRVGFVIHPQHPGPLRCGQRLLFAVAGQEHDLFLGAL
jgi:cyclopropane-fatty-acyl-phospholipid synthase